MKEIKEKIEDLRNGFNPTSVSLILDELLKKIEELESKLANQKSEFQSEIISAAGRR